MWLNRRQPVGRHRDSHLWLPLLTGPPPFTRATLPGSRRPVSTARRL